MKLLNYTSFYLAIAILLIVSVWGTIFYFIMLKDVKSEVDSGLINSKYLIIKNAKTNPTVLSREVFHGNNYTIHIMHTENKRRIKDRFQDTIRVLQNGQQEEPVRMLKTQFTHQNQAYELKIVASMVAEDKLISSLVKGLLGLYAAIIISSFIVQQLLVRKIWLPFRQLLDRLRNFQLDKNQHITPITTPISEFQEMNEVITLQMEQLLQTYHSQKQFLENAAHELQTPLAISINRLELLLEEDVATEHRPHIVRVIRTLERLNRLNASLLLLTKIENQQFTQKTPVSINNIFTYLLSEFEDLVEQKDLHVSLIDQVELQWLMNRDLAMILVSNLLKNAIVHNKRGGSIRIDIRENAFTITNDSDSASLDQNQIFERFKKQGKNKTSIGLGLAICKAIAQTHRLKLTYHFQTNHQFIVSA